MVCSECRATAAVMPTVYWPEDGDDAEEWPLCEGCYARVADEVLIVPGPVYCFGTCSLCGEWFSVRDLSSLTGGGRWGSPTGTCPACENRSGRR